MKKAFFLLSLILAGALNVPVYAAQKDDFRVVIDVSGSMVKTDPNNLRIPAMRMINGLIPTGANAGVWTFGRYVNMEVKLGTVDKNWRQLADQGVANIHSRGQFTNIESALNRATSGWNIADPKTDRNLIMLTDGQVDISKKPEKNLKSREMILNEVIPDLVKKGIKVHAIALSDKSDEALLKRLARQTSGSFEIAHTADDLQRIFLRMFERATKPDTVPIKSNKFTIDKSIKEMTLLVFRKGKKATRLLQPDMEVHTQLKHARNVSWRNDKGYDLITVNKPEAGEWTLDVETDPDNRVMIVTDLKLHVDDLPAFMTPDSRIDIRVELHNQDKKISKQSFLKFVEFKMSHTIGDKNNELELELKDSREVKDKGIYLQKIEQPLDEGTHEIVVNADSRTFSRSKRFTVEVQWPVIVEIGKTDQVGVYDLKISPRGEYIKPKTLSMIARFKLPDETKQLIELIKVEDSWRGKIIANEQDGLHHLMLHLQATTVDGKSITHELDTYSVLGIKDLDQPSKKVNKFEDISKSFVPPPEIEVVETEAPKNSATDSGWMNTAIIIIAINIFLLGVGGGIFYYLRKRSSKDNIDLLSDDKEMSSEEEELFGG